MRRRYERSLDPWIGERDYVFGLNLIKAGFQYCGDQTRWPHQDQNHFYDAVKSGDVQAVRAALADPGTTLGDINGYGLKKKFNKKIFGHLLAPVELMRWQKNL